MKRLKLCLFSCCWFLVVEITDALAQGGQPRAIPPRYVDDWFRSRWWMALALGALLGLIEARGLLPRLQPQPHKRDTRIAWRHVWWAIGISLVGMFALMLFDVSKYPFDNQNRESMEKITQMLQVGQSYLSLILGLAGFFATIAPITRLSSKGYRYMIIKR